MAYERRGGAATARLQVAGGIVRPCDARERRAGYRLLGGAPLRGGVLLCACVLLLGLIACGGESGDAGRSQAGGDPPAKTDVVLHAVATTGQIGDLVGRVGGERVQVTTLMGPGTDPHLYQASAGDVDRLSRADVIFYNGLHLEAKMAEVLARLGERRPTVAVAEAIPEDQLIAPESFAGAHDPHVWFAVPLWRYAVDAARDALIDVDPAGEEEYRRRAAAYRAELDELDAYIRAQVGRITPARRVLVTAHDAFNYFGRTYGIEVVGLQGISTATEAGTADVQNLAALIVERRIPAVFVETSVSPKAIEAVRAAVRARGFEVALGGTLFSDALGDAGTEAGTYVGMVRYNVDTIVAALAGPAGAEP
jgi:manganese/zinc/iron transport system substrate-binding protein